MLLQRILAICVGICCFAASSQAQISSPTATGQGLTAYTNASPNDPIYVFCSPDHMGNPVTSGSLTATPTGGTAPYTITWWKFDLPTNSWNLYTTQNGMPGAATINNVLDGGYFVTIADAGGNSAGCDIAWVWVKSTQVDVAAIAPGCTPFQLNGSYTATDNYTYYNPPAFPFSINNQTQITVCMSATHTYVSDLAFYMVGPATCGSPTVLLCPNPGALGQWATCNSGNNVNNLCFTTSAAGNIDVCTSGVPLSGTYDSYGPASTSINWAPFYGCLATEGGWKVQIYDCIGADVGALTNTTITFNGNTGCGPTTITYNSGGINSAINDGACSAATASIYTVPLQAAVPRTFTTTTTFTWTGANVTAPGSLTPMVSPCPTVDTWYYLNVTNSVGCTHKDSAFFDYQVPNSPVITPAGPFCVDAAPVNLVADLPLGTWTGTGITNAANGTFDPATAGAGTHTITYTTPPPCGSPTTLNIVVNPLPVLSETHTDVSCFGGSDGAIDLTVTPNTGVINYLWTPGNATTEDLTGIAANNYSVDVTDANGCVNTLAILISEPLAALNVTETHTDVSCGGLSDGSIDLTTTGGTSPYFYAWTPNVGTTEDVAGIPAANYAVVITDNKGCTFNLAIPIVEPPILVLAETHQNIPCFGQANGSIDLTPTGGTLPYSYAWSNLAISQDLTGLAAGTYDIIVTDFNNCTATITNILITEPLAALNVTETHIDATCFSYCDGSIDITVTGGTVPYIYNWTNSSTIEDPGALCASVYTVTVSDNNGCTFPLQVTIGQPLSGITVTGTTIDALCSGNCDGSIDITATGGSGGFTYSWTNGAGVVEDPIGLCLGTYDVTVTDVTGVCTITESFSIGEPTLVTVSTSADVTICINNSTTLQALPAGGAGSGFTVNWTSAPNDASLTTPTSMNPSVTPTANTTYTVTAADVNGCPSAPASVTVSLAAPLAITVTVTGEDTLCIGESSNYSFIATGGDGNYTYSDGAAAIISPVTVSPSATTTYPVTVTDGCGTPSVTDDVDIVVNPLPVIVINTAKDTCSPLEAEFNASGTLPSADSLFWDFGDDPSLPSNLSTSPTPSHTYITPGIYDVTLRVITRDGCTDIKTFDDFIVVRPKPTAGFMGSPAITDILHPEVTFIDQSTGASMWNYDFLDGTSSADQSPAHIFTDTGYFKVLQTVTTDHGCTDEATNTIYITPVYNLYIPNAFTPNDNGINETWNAHSEGALQGTYEMWVYNRWGEEVFRTKSFDNNWDGTSNGRVCPPGPYVYKVKIRSAEDFREKYYKGYVTLVR